MQELSLNILDIAQNGIKAKATVIEISIIENTTCNMLTIKIADNGTGMTKEQVQNVIDPFFTTRTTRRVGLGVPFFKMSAEMTGGSFKIESFPNKGTTVEAIYKTDSIDFMPLGDVSETMVSLIVLNPHIDFIYTYQVNDVSFTLDTLQIKQTIEDIPINAPEIISFIRDYLKENTEEIISKG